MFRRRPAATIFLTWMALDGALTRTMWTTYIVFAVSELGLDPLQLVLLGTVLEVTYLLFEVPTGVLADTVSRRLSIQIGVIGAGLAFLVLGVATSFWMAVVSNILWGIFSTFQSGADVAWLTDEVGEEDARRLYVRGDQVWHIGALVGIVGGVAIAFASVRLAIVVGSVGFIALGVWMLLVMPEEHFVRRERAEGYSATRELSTTFRAGVAEVRSHHVLGLILLVALLYGMASEGWDRLSSLHVLTGVGLDPTGGARTLLTLGLFEAAGLAVGLGVLTYVRRRLHLEGHGHVAGILAAFDLSMFGAAIAFALSGEVWLALLTSWLVEGLRSGREPIFTAWVNQGLNAETRATVNSFATQLHSVGEASAGPVLGAVGNRSVSLALGLSAVLRLPALLLYRRAIRRGTVGDAPPAEEVLSLEQDEPMSPEDRETP
jgi:DHA3 family tetracycline resistance protein-like MFS transporter